MARDINLSYCICGDFNDISFAHEKVGAKDREGWLISNFRQAVTNSCLTDVLLVGYTFTWFKSLRIPQEIEEKLDRAWVNDGFRYFLMHRQTIW